MPRQYQFGGSNLKCVICNSNEANQKHHVSYSPEELVIDVCKQCHQKIHQTHGVGMGQGEKNGKIKESHPFFTYEIYDKEKQKYFILDSETDEALANITCICGSRLFELFGRIDKSALYIRCSKCNVDRSITTLSAKQSEPLAQKSQDISQFRLDEVVDQV
jgi:ribosomal protein L31